MKKLGLDARPTEIHKDINNRFGIDLTTDPLSSIRGHLRKAASTNAPTLKPEQSNPSSAQAAPSARAASSATGSAVQLNDILTLKGLMGRVGADQLMTLINAMSR
jgi:hypothetical protein